MVEEDGSESLILKLYMKQLSLNLDVLSSILNHLGALGRAWTILTPDLRLRVLEEEELSTAPDRRANTGKSMARTPYVTVRGAEPTPAPPPQPKETTMAQQYDEDVENPEEEDEKKPPEPVDFDADKVDVLLDVVVKTKELPALLALNQAAMINLVIMAGEVQEELDKRAEEARKKAEEEEAKKEKKRQARLKEVEDEKILEEKKEREEREKAAKDREAARQKEQGYEARP